MKTRTNYQPEDIEALLAEKPFHELYAEEKAFVLEHLASAAEYEQMRETLLSIRGAAGEDQSSKPLRTSPRVKKELMAAFEKEKKKRALIWWNSFGLFLRTSLRFDLAVVRFGFAAVVLLLGIWIVFRMNGNTADKNPVLVKNENAVNPSDNLVKQNPLAINPADSAAEKNMQPSNEKSNPELNNPNQLAVQPSANNQIEIRIPDARDTMKSADGSSNGLISSNTKIHRNPLENVVVTRPFNGYMNNNMNSNFSNTTSNNISSYTGNPNLFVIGANGNPNAANDSLHRKNAMANQLGNTPPDSNLVVGIQSANGTNSAVCCSPAITFNTSPNYTYNWTPNATFNGSGATTATAYTINGISNGTFQTVVPKSRSLASDADALAFYCELK